MIAYHFVGKMLRDGRPVPPDGEWLTHEGPLRMCASGLHAGLTPWDALHYAPGPVFCEVELDSTPAVVTRDSDGVEHWRGMIRGGDKVVSSARRIIRRVDLTAALRKFVCDEALRCIHGWPEAPKVVRRYLETGDEAIRGDAWDAAYAAWRLVTSNDPAWATIAAVRHATRADAVWAIAWGVPWAGATLGAPARFNALALRALEDATS